MVSADILFFLPKYPNLCACPRRLVLDLAACMYVFMYVAFSGIPAVVLLESVLLCARQSHESVAPLWSPCPRIFSGILFHVDCCSVRSFAPERCVVKTNPFPLL